MQACQVMILLQPSLLHTYAQMAALSLCADRHTAGARCNMHNPCCLVKRCAARSFASESTTATTVDTLALNTCTSTYDCFTQSTGESRVNQIRQFFCFDDTRHGSMAQALSCNTTSLKHACHAAAVAFVTAVLCPCCQEHLPSCVVCLPGQLLLPHSKTLNHRPHKHRGTARSTSTG